MTSVAPVVVVALTAAEKQKQADQAAIRAALAAQFRDASVAGCAKVSRGPVSQTGLSVPITYESSKLTGTKGGQGSSSSTPVPAAPAGQGGKGKTKPPSWSIHGTVGSLVNTHGAGCYIDPANQWALLTLTASKITDNMDLKKIYPTVAIALPMSRLDTGRVINVAAISRGKRVSLFGSLDPGVVIPGTVTYAQFLSPAISVMAKFRPDAAPSDFTRMMDAIDIAVFRANAAAAIGLDVPVDPEALALLCKAFPQLADAAAKEVGSLATCSWLPSCFFAAFRDEKSEVHARILSDPALAAVAQAIKVAETARWASKDDVERNYQPTPWACLSIPPQYAVDAYLKAPGCDRGLMTDNMRRCFELEFPELARPSADAKIPDPCRQCLNWRGNASVIPAQKQEYIGQCTDDQLAQIKAVDKATLCEKPDEALEKALDPPEKNHWLIAEFFKKQCNDAVIDEHSPEANVAFTFVGRPRDVEERIFAHRPASTSQTTGVIVKLNAMTNLKTTVRGRGANAEERVCWQYSASGNVWPPGLTYLDAQEAGLVTPVTVYGSAYDTMVAQAFGITLAPITMLPPGKLATDKAKDWEAFCTRFRGDPPYSVYTARINWKKTNQLENRRSAAMVCENLVDTQSMVVDMADFARRTGVPLTPAGAARLLCQSLPAADLLPPTAAEKEHLRSFVALSEGDNAKNFFALAVRLKCSFFAFCGCKIPQSQLAEITPELGDLITSAEWADNARTFTAPKLLKNGKREMTTFTADDALRGITADPTAGIWPLYIWVFAVRNDVTQDPQRAIAARKIFEEGGQYDAAGWPITAAAKPGSPPKTTDGKRDAPGSDSKPADAAGAPGAKKPETAAPVVVAPASAPVVPKK